jgi:hypothetical protein
VIERLTSSLRQLATLSAAELASANSDRVRADCADAVRLELDCPQQALSPAQRAALSRLSDALDGNASVDRLTDAIRGASRALAG